jgi:hypothetical protein
MLLGSAANAAPKSENLLPDTTKGYVSIGDIEALRDAFNRSQWGLLVNDPVLQDFVKDFQRQLHENGVQRLQGLGLSWDDFNGVPGGEVSLATVRPGPGRMAVVVLVDVTGHQQQAAALVAKIDARLTGRGAQRMPHDDGAPVIFALPQQEGQRRIQQVAYILTGDLLAASDDPDVLQSIVAAAKDGRKDSLANLKSFDSIMTRCARSAGATKPHLRWFVDPFGYVEMIRSLTTRERRRGIDIYQALKNQGFTAVQGVGGFVNFSADKCELIHRTMVYAPPLPGHESTSEKYDLAARMLNFPVGSDLEPQAWVPKQVATYTSFNVDVKTAFAASETLVDEIMAEKGVFHDVLDSLKNDPDGPKVDVVKDFIGNLGNRVTIISDYQLPINTKSERLLVAVEGTNEKMLADTLEKLMKGDAVRREFEGHVIWEISDEQVAVPDVKIENPDGVEHADRADDDARQSDAKHAKEDRLIPTNSAMTVAYGHLFVASHMSFLEKVLHQAHENEGLAGCPDYRLIAEQAKQLGANQISFRLFSRTSEEYRPTYELIRTGRMPQSETMLGQLLNAVLGDGKDGAPRKQKIDGRTLPEFETVSHYFGPAGSFVSSETNGWFLVGFTMNKSLVSTFSGDVASGAAKPATAQPTHSGSGPAVPATSGSTSNSNEDATGNSTTVQSPASVIPVKSPSPKAPEQTSIEQTQKPVQPATAAASDSLPGPASTIGPSPIEPVTVQKPGETTTK